ncbi:hypothetical protein H5410_025967 [Solanum commersonii]|uniref:Peptidase M10 metallopeptidase domain-containing protein n=1 Tax=Solanum commersonii TaxID=4109 RepID=A0A9J5YUQ2_SOLCO|nr:hypothetical protein H5410_025967 [Solanum commersonii]
MNSGKSPTDHTVAHFSFFEGQPRWPWSKSKLKYAFLPENQLTDSVKAAFRRAFDKWSKVTPLMVDNEYLKEGMVDLESVAVHEIGHLLGWILNRLRFMYAQVLAM